ncbi:MAG: RecX family transcriptional regulator [Anaerolineae bacterium]|jgi:regulatory protein
MAGKITALEFQKKNPDRVSVFLDGKFAFGLPAIIAAHLKRGQVLSDAEIQSLEAEGAAETAYERTLNYLSYRPRSRAEVERYLQKRGLLEDQIAPVVQRLERAGLLDDEAFARYWVENRERHRPRGPRALRYELRQKGIANRTIDRALVSLDVSDSAYRSARRKARQLAHLDRETFMKKLVAYLARRGFDYEIARETAGRHWAELAAGE